MRQRAIVSDLKQNEKKIPKNHDQHNFTNVIDSKTYIKHSLYIVAFK